MFPLKTDIPCQLLKYTTSSASLFLFPPKALAIVAFNDSRINLHTFKSVLSVGPAYAIMNFFESKLFASSYFLNY